MTSKNEKSTNVVPIDADERILRNLAKNDPYGAAPPMGDAQRDRFIQNVLQAADRVAPSVELKPTRVPRKFYGVAAAVLIIIGAGITLALTLLRVPMPTPESAATIANKMSSTVNDRVPRAPTENRPDTLRTMDGPRVFSPSSGIEIALDKGTRVAVRHPSDGSSEVLLYQGSLWSAVNPEVPHDHLSIVTDDGSVEVKGTVFYVSKETNRSEVRVLRGKVQITDRGGRRTLVPEGRKIEVGDAEDRPLDTAEIDTGWAAVTAARLAPRPETRKEEAVMSHAAKRDRVIKAQSSEAEILAEIRGLRRDGNWEGAADKYELLIRTHRNSSAAKAALISLGELRLEKLHAPSVALTLFNRYLGLNEPTLAREALLGKANALRALGRTGPEQKILHEFLGRYPNAVQADAVRRRLDEIKTEGF